MHALQGILHPSSTNDAKQCAAAALKAHNQLSSSPSLHKGSAARATDKTRVVELCSFKL